jgi:hypothetical protein
MGRQAHQLHHGTSHRRETAACTGGHQVVEQDARTLAPADASPGRSLNRRSAQPTGPGLAASKKRNSPKAASWPTSKAGGHQQPQHQPEGHHLVPHDGPGRPCPGAAPFGCRPTRPTTRPTASTQAQAACIEPVAPAPGRRPRPTACLTVPGALGARPLPKPKADPARRVRQHERRWPARWRGSLFRLDADGHSCEVIERGTRLGSTARPREPLSTRSPAPASMRPPMQRHASVPRPGWRHAPMAPGRRREQQLVVVAAGQQAQALQATACAASTGLRGRARAQTTRTHAGAAQHMAEVAQQAVAEIDGAAGQAAQAPGPARPAAGAAPWPGARARSDHGRPAPDGRGTPPAPAGRRPAGR